MKEPKFGIKQAMILGLFMPALLMAVAWLIGYCNGIK